MQLGIPYIILLYLHIALYWGGAAAYTENRYLCQKQSVQNNQEIKDIEENVKFINKQISNGKYKKSSGADCYETISMVLYRNTRNNVRLYIKESVGEDYYELLKLYYYESNSIMLAEIIIDGYIPYKNIKERHVYKLYFNIKGKLILSVKTNDNMPGNCEYNSELTDPVENISKIDPVADFQGVNCSK